MRFRIYGPAHGRGSWANVTRGITGALNELGLLAGTFATDEGHEDDALPPASRAPIGLYIGSPKSADILRSRGDHEERWIMLAPNSSWLPFDLVEAFAGTERGEPLVTTLVAPSTWAAEVLRTHFPATPIKVWHHGVTPADWTIRTFGDGIGGMFHGLHLTSTWLDRKGTAPLVEAWSRVYGERGLLTVVRNWQQEPEVRLGYGVVGVPRLRGGMPHYWSHHVVVQPSRAEGFGMVPLEALCTGTPIVATACTGHADFMVPTPAGAVVVPHGELAPSDDGPGAMSPSVSADAIAEALVRARDARLLVAAIEAAMALKERWSWRRVTEEALRAPRST